MWQFLVWHGWYDVEEEKWEFLGLVISMGVTHLLYMKEYWSQEFVFRVPFIGEVFFKKKKKNPLSSDILDAAFGDFTPLTTVWEQGHRSEQLCQIHRAFYSWPVDDCDQFQSKYFIHHLQLKKPTKLGIHIYVLADSAFSCVCTFIPYHGKITTECLIKPDLCSTSIIVLQFFHNIIETLPDISGYHIFSGRLYTSPTLASELSKVRCHLTVTVMKKTKAKKRWKVSIQEWWKHPAAGMEWQTFGDIAQHFEHIHVEACQEESKRAKRRRNCGEVNCNCKLHGEWILQISTWWHTASFRGHWNGS